MDHQPSDRPFFAGRPRSGRGELPPNPPVAWTASAVANLLQQKALQTLQTPTGQHQQSDPPRKRNKSHGGTQRAEDRRQHAYRDHG